MESLVKLCGFSELSSNNEGEELIAEWYDKSPGGLQLYKRYLGLSSEKLTNFEAEEVISLIVDAYIKEGEQSNLLGFLLDQAKRLVNHE